MRSSERVWMLAAVLTAGACSDAAVRASGEARVLGGDNDDAAGPVVPSSATGFVDETPRKQAETGDWDAEVAAYGRDLFARGRQIFRDDTFGSEVFWSGELRLHEAILGAERGGVGPGLAPRDALKLGLRVDSERLPNQVVQAIASETIDLDSVDTTLALLRRDAIVGVRGFFTGGTLTAVGITCALCHSTVDPETKQVIHGAANSDLEIGLLLALARNSAAYRAHTDVAPAPTDLEDAVDRVFVAWPAGSFDATLDGISNPTRIPDVFVRHEAPFGWTGSSRAGPQDGLALYINGPHGLHATSAPYIAPIDWQRVLAMAAWLDSLRPPDVVVDNAAAARGRHVFTRAGCDRCHSGPAWTRQEVLPLSQLGTDPARAAGQTGYKIPGLLGLWWSAPYLHDGGVAVGPGEGVVGVGNIRARGLPIDPRASLRALLDRELRARVIAANHADLPRWSLHVRGVGHEFWVDPGAGFTPAEQAALVEYLLSLQLPDH